MSFNSGPTPTLSFATGTTSRPYYSTSSSSSSSSSTTEDDLVALPPSSPREPTFRPTHWKPIIDSPSNLSPPSTSQAYPQPWQHSYPSSSGSGTPPTPSLSPILGSRADPVRIGSSARRTTPPSWRTSPTARASREARRNELHASVSNVAAARIPLRTATSDMDVDSLLSRPVDDTSRRAVHGSAAEASDEELNVPFFDDGLDELRRRRSVARAQDDDRYPLNTPRPDAIRRRLELPSNFAEQRSDLNAEPRSYTPWSSRTTHRRSRISTSPLAIGEEGGRRQSLDRPATLLRYDQPRLSPPRRSPGPQETRDTARAASREAAQPYRAFNPEHRFGSSDSSALRSRFSALDRASRDGGPTIGSRRFGDPDPEIFSRAIEERRRLGRYLETQQEDINAQRRRLQALQARISASAERGYIGGADFDDLPSRAWEGFGTRPLLPEQRPPVSSAAGSFGAFSSRSALLGIETERLVEQMMRSPRPSIFETAHEIIYRSERGRGLSGVASAMRVVSCKAHAELEGEVDECCAVCHDEYTPEIQVGTTPCRHMFHKSCLETWFETSTTCPMCRKPMRDEDAYQEQRAAARAIRHQLLQDLEME